MDRSVKVACVQVEPVVLDREATLDKLETVAAQAAKEGAELVVFPETFVPVYPSSRWAKAFAGWEADGAKETFARIAQESVAVGSPAERRAHGPRGARGGGDGAPGRTLINGEEQPAKVTRQLRAGDVIRIETPGGGGFGSP